MTAKKTYILGIADRETLEIIRWALFNHDGSQRPYDLEDLSTTTRKVNIVEDLFDVEEANKMPTVKVTNCIDCPAWNDGAGGEYGEGCRLADKYITVIYGGDDDRYRFDSAPLECPLRKGAITVQLKESV